MGINNIINYFIPKKYSLDKELNRKSRFIVWFVFLTLTIGLFFSILITIQNPEDIVNPLMALIFIPVMLAALFHFRKKGSFIITTHWLCGVFSIAMFVMPNTSGGIFSPDLPTVYILPIFALIMSNQRVAFFYAGLTVCNFIVYYVIDTNYPAEHLKQASALTPDYFFFNVALNFCVILFLVFRNENIRLKILGELKKTNILISEKNKEISDSIHYAKRIQTAILPSDHLVNEHLNNSFILYKPKDIVAGDFYWMEPVDDLVLFAVADCTGHGVPGAMISVVCINSLNRAVREYKLTKPAEILDKTKELIIEEFKKSREEIQDGMDISLCALNLKTRQLEWAGANNPLCIVRKNDTELEERKANKQPIGKYESSKPFTNHALKLSEGDTIYLYSDGYQDQFGGKEVKKYKSGNFKKTLVRIAQLPIEQQAKVLNDEFDGWRGEIEQIDDVCVMGVKI